MESVSVLCACHCALWRKNCLGKKSFCFDNFDLFPLKHEPEFGCSCENCVDLAEYRKDPSLEKFSSQQFCLDKCKCRLCVRKCEESSESEFALKKTEEALWQKNGIVVTKVDELQIEQEQEEDKQAEYRRNFPHTCLQWVLDESDKFIRAKSESEDGKQTKFVFGTRSPGNKTGLWKVLGAGPAKQAKPENKSGSTFGEIPRKQTLDKPGESGLLF